MRILGTLAFTFTLLAQAPEKARIEGAVVNTLTGQPVRKARLMLLPVKAGEPLTANSDAQGKYIFPAVLPGVYRLTAQHEGFSGQAYGAKEPGEERKGDMIEVTAGGVKSKVDLKLTPLGSIFGHVRDEDGDPVRNVEMTAMNYGYSPKGKSLQVRSGGQTDATGEFRLFDLPPGKYYLRAKPMSAQMPGNPAAGEVYATVFYPAAPDAATASVIDLAAGQEVRGADFVLHPTVSASIKGRVIAPPGGEKCTAWLGSNDTDMSFGDDVMMGTVGFVMSDSSTDGGNFNPDDVEFFGQRKADKDGNFEFKNVPAGTHILNGRCMLGKQRYTTKMTLQLDGAGRDHIELRPAAPSSIRAQVQLEGETKSKVSEAHVFLRERPMEIVLGTDGTPEPKTGSLSDDGLIEFKDLGADIYHLRVNPPKDLYVKSILQENRDVSEAGVDLSAGGVAANVRVVLSADSSSIEGTVENGAGAKVILIPADSARQHTEPRMTLAGDGGKFSFEALPPGKYRLFAWEEVDFAAAMYDADFRKPFEGKAESVEVAAKQKGTVQLKLIPVK